ncbi:hypothetical protein YC2023_019608 [Brassica napus]
MKGRLRQKTSMKFRRLPGSPDDFLEVQTTSWKSRRLCQRLPRSPDDFQTTNRIRLAPMTVHRSLAGDPAEASRRAGDHPILRMRQEKAPHLDGSEEGPDDTHAGAMDLKASGSTWRSNSKSKAKDSCE